MDEQQLASFEGYAIVEIMGHQKATGYVTTQYFGGTAIFRVVQQEYPVEEITLEADQWLDGERLYAGSKVRVSRPRAETFVAAASLYRMTPCTEQEANAMQPRKIEVLERAERKAIEQVPVATVFRTESADEDAYYEDMEERQR